MATIEDLPVTAKRSTKDGERLEARWTEDVFECSDTWIVPREDVPAFLRAAGGTIESIGGVLSRVVPLRNEDFPFAIATDISFSYNQGGWDQVANDYDVARIRVRYQSPRYDEEYLSINTSPDTRILYKPASVNSGLAQEVVHGLQYSITQHKMATASHATYAAYGGYINNASWRGFPTGCVLYVPPTSSQTFTVGGENSYSITHGFRVSRIRWDYEYDPSGTLVSQGVPPTADFTTVFGF